jgi:hypothetical protein
LDWGVSIAVSISGLAAEYRDLLRPLQRLTQVLSSAFRQHLRTVCGSFHPWRDSTTSIEVMEKRCTSPIDGESLRGRVGPVPCRLAGPPSEAPMCWRTPFALTSLLASLATAPAAAQSNSGTADAREVQVYRLTMPKLNQLNQAIADLHRQRDADPTSQRLASKKKELAVLSEKDEPSDAERERMDRLEAEIEEAERAEDAPGDKDQSLSAMAERMAADPRVAGALKRASLAPREAATMQLALFQVAFAVGMLESGTIKEIPKDVNPDNVKFYQANRAAIAGLTALQERDD